MGASVPIAEHGLNDCEGSHSGCICSQDARSQRYANTSFVGGDKRSLLIGKPPFGAHDNDQTSLFVPKLGQSLDRVGNRRVLVAEDDQAIFIQTVEKTLETLLFPYLREMAKRDARMCLHGANPFGTVENPIRMMEREHREAAAGLDLIREMTGGYVAPLDGCITYELCMADLKRFEQDLHRHVHLENNVLFPRALALEAQSA